MVANTLEIPVVVTLHDQKKYGDIVPALKDIIPENSKIFHKTLYSMLTEEVLEYLKTTNRKTVVLIGVNSHVCIFQTCYDLLQLGYEVYCMADCISSQNKLDRTIGLRRMEKLRGIITTWENIIFDFIKDSGKHPKFNELDSIFSIKGLDEQFEDI